MGDPRSRTRGDSVPIAVNATATSSPTCSPAPRSASNYPSPNKLWINDGNKFVLHQGPPTLEIGNNCAAAADLTHNGLDDIAVCTPTKGFYLYRALGNGNYARPRRRSASRRGDGDRFALPT